MSYSWNPDNDGREFSGEKEAFRFGISRLIVVLAKALYKLEEPPKDSFSSADARAA